ncbi:hypothetical protein P5G62_027395 [Neobacillus sp. 179-C4.2 HS]|uniref:Lipoprotein n=1 Tax=Neobacillus driksii TaxID=3035913 RepID=A0ABV4Z139_9BACI|nr:hypothetical protein [Neobacillus sp. 179.-C4.2 HS]MDP5197703.1 hypothetical protein [Neobacillus sp. 179.-C4.2 HS]
MKITKKVRSILLPFVLLIGVTGCMNEKSSENAILTYLEETYNETFEVETFNEGSTIFKNMYGADKVIVHPKGKPEHVFLAGEDRDHEGEYYDNYVLSKWSDELTKRLKPEISKLLPEDAEYRVLLFVEDGKYDSSMKDMSVDDYFANVNNDVSIELKAAIKSAGKPNVTDYNEPIYQLLQVVKQMDVKSSRVSVGFVDSAADIYDYIRTSSVNNTPWSNLDAKVYATIMVDKRFAISDTSQIEEYYKEFKE